MINFNLTKIKSIFRSKKLQLIGILTILASIPAAVYLVQRLTSYRTPAQVVSASVYFSPSTQTLPPDSTFRIMVNSGTQNVVFVRVVFNFDTTKVRLRNEIITSTLTDIISKTTMVEANSNGRVVIVLAQPPQSVAPTGIFEVANFNLGVVTTSSNSTASLSLDSTSMQVVAASQVALPLSATSATLNLNPVASSATPTPTTGAQVTNTPTPSPIPTLTPTPTSTPTPTPRPTYTPTPSPIPQPVTTNFNPIADTRANSESPGTNYATNTIIYVDGFGSSPTSIAYLKFNLTSLNGKTITSAIFRFRDYNPSSGPQYIKSVSDTSWSESTLTYNNRPVVGSTIGQIGSTSGGNWYDINITSGVKSKAGQLVSIAIDQTIEDAMHFYSRETTSSPVLVVTYY